MPSYLLLQQVLAELATGQRRRRRRRGRCSQEVLAKAGFRGNLSCIFSGEGLQEEGDLRVLPGQAVLIFPPNSIILSVEAEELEGDTTTDLLGDGSVLVDAKLDDFDAGKGAEAG